MRTLRKCFVSEVSQTPSDVIVLGPHWRDEPWVDVRENELPAKWTKLVLVVMPGAWTSNSKINAELGHWLKAHVSKHRNMVRFLLQDGARCFVADPSWQGMQGTVIKMDRGRRRCCLEFVFDEVRRTIWVGYEMLQPETENKTENIPEVT